MRSLGITLISLGLTSIVIGNAYYQKKQFYPSIVYITKSNPSMAVIYVQAFILVILAGKLMRKVFFGQLRAAEFEHLVERSWYAVTETCLAFTMFRDDFSPKFVALFILLLFLKCFHWLAEDRVDFMERSPVLSHLFHVRIVSLLMMLAGLDMHFVEHAYHSTVTKGASVQLVFGFEYAILLTIVFNITIKYSLHTIDLNSDSPWENKAVFLLYTELVMGFIKVILYITFVAIMVRIYTLPLFAFRPMYYTMRSFKKAFNDVILSRRAIRNMNTLYPDATPEELAAADNVCIICREEMVSASKKLPCNHIFHTACLRSWFQRQQTCPTCRLNILRTPTPSQPPQQQQPQQQQQQQQQPQQQVPLVGPPPIIPQMPPGGLNIPPFVGPLPFWQMFQPPVQAQPQPPQAQAQPQPPQQRPDQPPAATTQQTAAAGTSIPSGAAAGGSADGTASQQQAPGTTAGGAAAGATSVAGSGTGGMPFICPPFPFMPFIPPPPVPPANLAAFTTEELRRMEGNTREAVEARLQCLRNIQLLLDASVAMMQQYASVAVRIEQVTTKVGNGQVLANGTGSIDLESNKRPAATEQGAAGETELPADVAAAPVSSASSSSSSSSRAETYPVSNSSSDANNSSPNEQEEIRRRRLQRFAQATD